MPRAEFLAVREDFTVALATTRSSENCRRRLALRPGGTPQEISRGQARASGRGPRLPRRTGQAPAGPRRNFWRRPPRSRSATTRRLGPIGTPVIVQHRGPFSSMPRWGTEPLGTFSGGYVRCRGLAPGQSPPASLRDRKRAATYWPRRSRRWSVCPLNSGADFAGRGAVSKFDSTSLVSALPVPTHPFVHG